MTDATQTDVNPFLANPRALPIPWVESPFFDRLLEQSEAPESMKKLARHFHDEGFVILDVFDEHEIGAVVDEYERLFDPTTEWDVGPSLLELLRRDPTRKQDAWFVSEPIKALACNEKALDVLRYFYGREPIPFQTLNFLPGTQQTPHSDDMHFSSMPERFMCGIWVALEDCTEENGPLFYYPKSHRLPRFEVSDLDRWAEPNQLELGDNYAYFERYLNAVIESHGLKQKKLTIQKGQALIWAANLIHGGCPITRPGATRMSQVTHYYFEDCIFYTPAFSNSLLGEWRVRDRITDIRTGEIVQQTLNGTPVEFEALANGNVRIVPLEGPARRPATPAAPE